MLVLRVLVLSGQDRPLNTYCIIMMQIVTFSELINLAAPS
jgi:hypothetical protein